MFRFIAYLLLLAAIALAGTWMFQNNGDVAIDWMDYRIETSVAFAAIMLFTLLFVAVIVVEIMLWLKKAPRRISADIAVNRNIRGLSLLTEGFAALIDGDVKRAHELAKSSRRLLPAQPYTLLLSAETAKLRGDMDEARRHLQAMLKNKSTELLGLKGLVNSARMEGNLTQAITLAERARTLKPKSDWTAPVLLDLYKKTGDWEAARNTIESFRRKNYWRNLFGRGQPAEMHSKMLEEKALASLMLSRKLYADGNVHKSYKFAKEAYDLNPGFVPAAVNLCENLLALGKRGAAKNLVEEAWAENPHPELYDIYYKIYPDEKPKKKLKRFQRLIAINPESGESYKALAMLTIDLGMYDVAKKNLVLAIEKGETKSTLKLLAQVEELSGGDKETARQLIKKAEYASGDPAWVCDACNSPAGKWDIACKRCGAYDSIVWKEYDKITILGAGGGSGSRTSRAEMAA